mgnify:CR=1 FL=1
MTTMTMEDLSLVAQQALVDSPFYALRQLRVDRQGTSLLLSGSVTTFYHKQRAQELIRSIADGVTVVNDVKVS